MARKPNSKRVDLWRDRIRRQEASGLSVNQFYARERCSSSAFYRWKQRLPLFRGVSPIVNLVPAARNPKFRPSRPQRRAWIETRVRLVTNERRLSLPASALVAD
jgi:hypothetical protein